MSIVTTTLKEVILFNISDILCGLNIHDVLEIKKVVDITTVYGAPDVVRGVINLRGQIVTVLDVRKRFNLQSLESSSDERVIIVPVGGEQVGLLVDSVDDVIQINDDDELPVPPNMNPEIARYFATVFQWGDRIVSLVALDELVHAKEERNDSVMGGQ